MFQRYVLACLVPNGCAVGAVAGLGEFSSEGISECRKCGDRERSEFRFEAGCRNGGTGGVTQPEEAVVGKCRSGVVSVNQLVGSRVALMNALHHQSLRCRLWKLVGMAATGGWELLLVC